jgi:cobalt-zinc-cadmium resistance protein CzcA
MAKMKIKIFLTSIIYLIFCLAIVTAQTKISKDEAIQMANDNNLGLDVFRQSINQQSALVNAQVPTNKTHFYYEYDHNNIAENGNPIHVLGVGQSFKWPSIYNNYELAQQSRVLVQKQVLSLEQLKLSMKIEKVYEDYAYYVQKEAYLNELDSIYNDYLEKANRNLELGGGTLMESLTARQKIEALNLDVNGIEHNIIDVNSQLNTLLQSDQNYEPLTDDYRLLQKSNTILDSSLFLIIGENEITSHGLYSAARFSDRLPDINISLFSGMNSFNDVVLYPGIQVGASIALSQGYFKARKQADQIQTDMYKTKLEDIRLSLNYKKKMLEQKLENLEASIGLYINLEATADQLISTAKKALAGGEINYFQYLSTLDEALHTKMKKIELIHQYNQNIIEYNYLLNE